MKQFYTFRLFSDRHLQKLGICIGDVISGWLSDWIGSPGEIKIINAEVLTEESAAGLSTDLSWACIDNDGADWCLVGIAKRDCQEFCVSLMESRDGTGSPALISASINNGLLSNVGTRAVYQLGSSIVAAGGEMNERDELIGKIPDEYIDGRPGKGTVYLKIKFAGNIHIHLLLSSDIALRYMNSGENFINDRPDRSAAGLVSFGEALQAQKVRVAGCLGSLSVPLDTLASLQNGDVVKLDKFITEPASLKIGDVSLECSGYIGRCQNHFALRLTELKE